MNYDANIETLIIKDGFAILHQNGTWSDRVDLSHFGCSSLEDVAANKDMIPMLRQSLHHNVAKKILDLQQEIGKIQQKINLLDVAKKILDLQQEIGKIQQKINLLVAQHSKV